ncbi:MAG: PrsW family intramembrane metalloprotease [Lachnospiraceae bacterium]|nr:PrsW family intramembrane metalloprotease [Lachnospiraceae bacterium]
MENINYILYICITLPLLLSLFVINGRSRAVISGLIIGSTVAILVSEINSAILQASEFDYLRVTINATPVTEELIKALPVLYFAMVISDERRTLLQFSFAIGLGFAILENSVVLVQSIDSVTILWAFSRGIGASLMHGLCTTCVGVGVSYVKKRRKLFTPGTIALLLTAMTYHSTFNVLVQSGYKYYGVFLPLVTYIPIVYAYINRINNNKKKLKEKA